MTKKMRQSGVQLSKGVGMKRLYVNNVVLAIVASILFMAGVRAAVELVYPDGTENLSKGKVAVVHAPGPVMAKR